MLRNIVVVLVVLLVGVVVYWGLSEKESRANENPSSFGTKDDDKVAGLEAEITQMKKEMRKVSIQSNLAARMGGGLSPADVAREEERPEEGNVNETAEEFDARMEEQRRSIAARFEELAKAYQRETRDPSWSDRAESELGTIILELQKSGTTGATILNSECKSTVCKIDMAYNDAQAQSQMSGKIRSPFFGGGEARRFEEDGRFRSTTYIYREGYESPVE
jgi:hypothetical protein